LWGEKLELKGKRLFYSFNKCWQPYDNLQNRKLPNKAKVGTTRHAAARRLQSVRAAIIFKV